MQEQFEIGQTDDVEMQDTATTYAKLNIIDMRGETNQPSSSFTALQQSTQLAQQKSSLLKKITKIKDQSKFNVKALVQGEKYLEDRKE